MILRRLARPLLAATFIYGGINALRQSEGHAEVVKPLLDKTVQPQVDALPDAVPTDPETLVKLDAAVKIAAGTALALGRLPRLASLALLGSLVPTTIAGHPFWEAKDPAERNEQLIHLLKNAGLAGGLLLAAADTHGKPSLNWRARNAAKHAAKEVALAGENVQQRAGKAAEKGKKTFASALPI